MPTRRKSASPQARLAVVVVALLVASVGMVVIARSGDDAPSGIPTVAPPPGGESEALPDPFAWDPDREDEFVDRAATGSSHLLYSLSPGGVVASAERTARWRKPIEAAAEDADVDPDTLEGLVFLESAGREDATTPAGVEGAAGLTQILPETGQNLLKMRVDTRTSAKLTRKISRASGDRLERLREQRAAADERFDGRKALQATARYLTFAKGELGRDDLAFVSYHMGVGNLQDVLKAFGSDDVSYPELYFDSTYDRHAAAYAKLASLGDDSSNYYWKVLAGREIMRLYREDRDELVRLALLHQAKGSAEEVLHPSGETERFQDPDQLRKAWDRGDIVAFPTVPRITGLARDARMGELAKRLDQPAGLYRGLRPEALAMTMYIGAQVRSLSGAPSLIVTSTVRDEHYQRELVKRNREATRNYSLHTTGWAFDVERRYASRKQALAFQSVLDRLQVLGAIAWVREPEAIHITVSREAKALLPLLDRLPERG